MVLTLRNVEKHFTKFRLRIDELTFEDNKYYVILGPSGSGKTTTLRIIAGLEIPNAGSIILDGKDITWLPPWKRDIGLVFQNYALYPHLTAYENIAVPLKVKKLPESEIRSRVLKMAEILEIDTVLDHKPNQLSGGQQQRVALARALVKEPKVLLLDEPLSNLDARLRLELRGFLKDLQRRMKMTVIHVTHDQEEAMSLGDGIVLINDGKIVQVATPQELYRRPRTVFAFNFLGLSNMLPAEMMGLKGADYIGFRPEDVKVAEDEGDFEGVIHTIQYLGSYKLLEVYIDGKHKIKAKVPPGERVKEGMKVKLKVDRNYVLKFKDGFLVE